MPRSKPVLITLSVFAALDIVLGGAVLAEFIDPQVVGLVALVSAGVQGGFAFYLSGSNTPAATVLATQEYRGGDVVAGPASSFTTGAAIEPSVPVGEIAVPPQR